MTVCLRCALRHPSLVKRASRVALVVGVVLTAINQGDAIIAGQFTGSQLWKIPLTFLVPYAVSTYSTLGAVRSPAVPADDPGPIPPLETLAAGNDRPAAEASDFGSESPARPYH